MKNKGIMVIRFLLVALFSMGVMANAALAEGAPRIGIAQFVTHPALDAITRGVQDELLTLNPGIEFDVQNANGDINAAASIAKKFQSDKVTLAVGVATPTAQALVKTLKGSTPVVFTGITDPVKAGLVASLSKGEKGVTGYSNMTPVRQQIELLMRTKKVKRLGHVYTSSEMNAVVLADLVKDVCKILGIEFVGTTVTKSAEVKQAVQSIIGRVDALYVTTDNTVVSAMSSVADVAQKNKVPIMSADTTSAATNPVLVAWGFDYYRMGRNTGKMINEILKGKKPEQMPTRFMKEAADMDLLVNLDVAKKLGVTIPKDILYNANQIMKDGKIRKK